jgi:cell division protein FtsI (penicillin-binding protein 3)
LGAFSRLVNGGKPVALHFLKGTVDGLGNFESYEFKAPGREVAKVSAVLGASFAASAGEHARFFAAEYLFPLSPDDDFVVESQEGDQTAEVFKRSQTYDGLLVAAAPATNPRLVLLISVGDGEFELSSASPMRKFGDAFLRLAAKELSKRTETDFANYVLPGDDDLLAAWFQQHQQDKEVETVEKAHHVKVPNVVGMSLRKALLELMPCKVEIEIEGAGRVVSQAPEPGQDCGPRVFLKLASDPVEQSQK